MVRARYFRVAALRLLSVTFSFLLLLFSKKSVIADETSQQDFIADIDQGGDFTQLDKGGGKEKYEGLFNGIKKLELTIDGVQYNFNISFDFFSNDLQRISKFCSKVSDEHHFQQCNEELTRRVDNALLLLYMDHARHMADYLVSMGFDLRLAEGGSMYFLNLLRAKQKVSSNNNIRTICETGFNLGHSSLLWLTSNRNAKVYSFDLGEHKYVVPAADYILRHYSDRFNLLLGDSRDTLPDFFSKNNVSCDIFFVDGGHVDYVPQLDMFWAVTMLNKTNKNAKILVDDLHLKDVKAIWRNMIKGKLIRADDVIERQLPSYCLNTDKTFSKLLPENDPRLCEHAATMERHNLHRSMYALDFGIASLCSQNEC